MLDREFIDTLITATMPRIEDLVLRTYERAANEAKILDLLASSVGLTPANEDAKSNPQPQVLRAIWNAALTDAAVSLLWGLAERAKDGSVRCTSETLEAVADRVDRAELARETGVAPDDLRFVLREMSSALAALVAVGPLEVTIDRRPIVLRPR